MLSQAHPGVSIEYDEEKSSLEILSEPLIRRPKVESLVIEPRLTYVQAIKKVSTFALPFTLSRIAVAVNVIGNGFVFPRIGNATASAGGLITSGAYVVIGPVRSILLSSGILIGKINGRIPYILDDSQAVEKAKNEIGDILKKSLLIGTALSIPSIVFMLLMGELLNAIGVSEEISQQAENFLRATAFGIPPMFWSTSDQQFTLGIQKKNLSLVTGGVFAGMSMLLGYPLALGSFGLPKLGVAGLGYGMAGGAWLSFLGLRAYFMRNEFAPYHLFNMKFMGIESRVSDQLKLGFPLGLQAFTEWGNLTGVSMLMGILGEVPSAAAMVSIQAGTALTLGIAAMGQATSVLISSELGSLQAAYEKENQLAMKKHNNDAKIIGNAGIISGLLCTLPISALLVIFPKQITSLFITEDAAANQDLLIMAQAMLIANAIGFIVDTARNMGSSSLSGAKDVIFAPIISLITMSIMALSVGGGLSIAEDWNANWLFITRDVGILLAATAIVSRWLAKDFTPQIHNTTESLNKSCCFFSRKTPPVNLATRENSHAHYGSVSPTLS